MTVTQREFNQPYENEFLTHVAFPLGGIGAGMICLEGTGKLSNFSLRYRPDVFNEPLVFSALYVKGATTARVLEGPVQAFRLFGRPTCTAGKGYSGQGLARFGQASFDARFPFGGVSLRDESMPVDVELTGWSPFMPGDADSSSLPAAALEYCFVNRTDQGVEGTYSFHAMNFMSTDTPGESVEAAPGGFILRQPGSEETPWHEGAFSAVATDPAARTDCGWFRGGSFDPLTMVWKTVAGGDAPERGPHTDGNPSPGASLYVPFRLGAGEEKTIRLLLTWYVPLYNAISDLKSITSPGMPGASNHWRRCATIGARITMTCARSPKALRTSVLERESPNPGWRWSS